MENINFFWFAEVGDILIDYSDNQFKVVNIDDNNIELECLKNKVKFKNTIKFFRKTIKQIKKAR